MGEELKWINNVNRSGSFGIWIITYAYTGEYVHIQNKYLSLKGLCKKNQGEINTNSKDRIHNHKKFKF